MLELMNITKRYDSQTILNKCSYTFNQTGFYLITGPSGIGKSTLLNIISGFDSNYDGKLIYNKQPLNKKNYQKNEIAYDFQEHLLIDNLSVIDNLTLFRSDKETLKQIDELLHILDLEQYKKTKVHYLSQGEKKRVSFIRTIIKDANIYLFDEPTNFLDEKNKIKVLTIIKKLSQKALVIVASHDQMIEKYMDYHISIKDQQLITFKNSNNYSEPIIKSKTNNSHPQFKKIIKIAMSHLLNNKKKNFLAILVLCFSMLILSLCLLGKDIDTYIIETNTIAKTNPNIILFTKTNSYKEEDIKEIKKEIKSPLYIGYNYYNNENVFSLESNIQKNSPLYYQGISSECIFYDIDKSFLERNQIIGNLPVQNNEILITSYLAELLIYNKQYSSFDDILTNGYLTFDNKKYKITGLLKQDTAMFEILKTKTEFSQSLNNLYSDFFFEILSFQNAIYIPESSSIKNYSKQLTTLYTKVFTTKEAKLIVQNFQNVIQYQSKYSKRVESLKLQILWLKNICFYLHIAFILFYFLILINYINNNFFKYQKESRIWQINGYYNTNKIIIWLESFICQMIACILNFIFLKYITTIGNNLISNNLGYSLYPISLELNTFITFSIILIILNIIIYPVYKNFGKNSQ